VRIIATSGLSAGAVRAGDAGSGVSMFLAKPCTAGDLLQAVRQTIAAGR
jgi:hypothetical protein